MDQVIAYRVWFCRLCGHIVNEIDPAKAQKLILDHLQDGHELAPLDLGDGIKEILPDYIRADVKNAKNYYRSDWPVGGPRVPWAAELNREAGRPSIVPGIPKSTESKEVKP